MGSGLQLPEMAGAHGKNVACPMNLIHPAGPGGGEITETNEVRRDGLDGDELDLVHTDGAPQTSWIPTEAGMEAGSPERKDLGAGKKKKTVNMETEREVGD